MGPVPTAICLCGVLPLPANSLLRADRWSKSLWRLVLLIKRISVGCLKPPLGSRLHVIVRSESLRVRSQQPQKKETAYILDEERNLQLPEKVFQIGSGLPRHVHAGAHDWGQVLTFQGKSCSLFGSFTNS